MVLGQREAGVFPAEELVRTLLENSNYLPVLNSIGISQGDFKILTPGLHPNVPQNLLELWISFEGFQNSQTNTKFPATDLE